MKHRFVVRRTELGYSVFDALNNLYIGASNYRGQEECKEQCDNWEEQRDNPDFDEDQLWATKSPSNSYGDNGLVWVNIYDGG